MMELIRTWEVPTEVVGKRKFTYLIGGEAFDYLSLLERLTFDPKGLFEKTDVEELLFYGHLPPHNTKDVIRKYLGWKKYRAYLNYWYGVVIEQCLQYVVEIEVSKEFRAKGIVEPDDLADLAFLRLYAEEAEILWGEFCRFTKRTRKKSMSVTELEAYTYWLFKRRFEESDQSRFASDTLKGLHYFDGLSASKKARSLVCQH